MRVAIDASALLGDQGGMRIYLRELLRRLPALDPGVEYFHCVVKSRFSPAEREVLGSVAGPRARAHLRRFPYRLLMALETRGLRVQERWLLPRVDLYHGACQVVPPLGRTRSVMTAHHYEEARYAYRSRWEDFYYRTVFEQSVRRADHLIADSKYTRRFLVEKLGRRAEDVTVVYHGIFDPRPAPGPAELAAFRSRRGLPERFIVCVSHMHPRKNTVGLVRAFARLGDAGKGLSLVLVGRAHDAYRVEIEAAMRASGVAERVLMTGAAPHEEVPLFYACAEAFVLPSFLEGFGIPLIEAMAMGCPVAAADSTAIPEIVGDAGLLFDPGDDEAIAAAMRRLLEDSALRKDLIARGLARAAQFSWEEAARRTLGVYRRVLA